jgi:hypothetical protein
MEILETFMSVTLLGAFLSFFIMAICIGYAETIDEDHPDALK